MPKPVHSSNANGHGHSRLFSGVANPVDEDLVGALGLSHSGLGQELNYLSVRQSRYRKILISEIE